MDLKGGLLKKNFLEPENNKKNVGQEELDKAEDKYYNYLKCNNILYNKKKSIYCKKLKNI